MINNDTLIKLVFALRDIVDTDNMEAVPAWLQEAGLSCTDEHEQSVICEELFNMGKPVNNALIALAEKIPFLENKKMKLELMRLTKEVSDGSITDALLKKRIMELGKTDGPDGEVREYIIALLRACELFGAPDSMPLLRAKLTEIGVI